MANKRGLKLWLVNVVSFILLTLLSVTGLINWLILPKGYGATRGLLRGLRHILIEIHEWTALLFIVTTIIHIILHWTYVKNNLKKYNILKY
jgi:hypothetical protein